jgi:hypothetical protein
MSRRNDDRMRRRSADRRAAKGEGANARQAAFQRTGHGRSSQHEGEGKEKAQGSHLTVSGSDAGAARRFRRQIDNYPVFPDACAKAGNGFVGQEKCFVASGSTKQFFEKLNDFNEMIANSVVHWPSRSLRYRDHHLGCRETPAPSDNPVRLFNLSLVKEAPSAARCP